MLAIPQRDIKMVNSSEDSLELCGGKTAVVAEPQKSQSQCSLDPDPKTIAACTG